MQVAARPYVMAGAVLARESCRRHADGPRAFHLPTLRLETQLVDYSS